jgi:hypothetical protein
LPTLATPTTGETVGPSLATSGGENLRTQIAILNGKYLSLPKIKWAESIEGQDKSALDSEVSWGKFGPVIRLWERYLGREAPAPTKPDGKEGNHRLSSKFTEWMMGLPEGWITDVGLTRNEELKLAGNGVVPQQAELALKILLENIPPAPLGPNLTKLPTPTVSDTYTDNLKSTQQKEGSMHSVTLAQISQRI